MKLSLSDELKPYWLSERYSAQSRQFADWLNVLRTGWINKYVTTWAKPQTKNEKNWFFVSSGNHHKNPINPIRLAYFSINNPAVVSTSKSLLRVHELQDTRANASCFSSKLWTAVSTKLTRLTSCSKIFSRHYVRPRLLTKKGFWTLAALMISEHTAVLFSDYTAKS